MAKSFLCRRTAAGKAVMTRVMDQALNDLHLVEKQHGRKSLEASEQLLILASMHYVVEDYEKAEPLLLRYVSTVKEKLGTNSRESFYGLWLLADAYMYLNRYPEARRVSEEGKAISRTINCPASDSLIDALMGQVEGYRGKSDLHSRRRGLVMALIALSWCMTSGFHRSSGGVQALEALRSSFEPYGIGKEEWEWIVKHAHMTRYDFLGLLSLILTHTHLVPALVLTDVRASRALRKVG